MFSFVKLAEQNLSHYLVSRCFFYFWHITRFKHNISLINCGSQVHEGACMLDKALQSHCSNYELETNPDKLKFMGYFSLSLRNLATFPANISSADEAQPQVERKIALKDKRFILFLIILFSKNPQLITLFS